MNESRRAAHIAEPEGDRENDGDGSVIGESTDSAPTVPAESAHVRLDGLTKSYPGQAVQAVDGVSLSLEKGKLLALLGPSGCGKTTTLRMIAGLLETTSGSIWVNGDDITHTPVHRRGMGMVFQSYALFPHLNVADNVSFGLEMRGIRREVARERVQAALEMVQLGHLRDRRVKEISGGQQQRVALARALVIEPSVLLLDEPLSNLDAKLRDSMRAEIRSIVYRLGLTTVFVTHDQDEALSMADSVAVMRDGRIEQLGTPEDVYQRPTNRFVADFVGRANLLDGVVVRSTRTSAVVNVPGLAEVDAVHVGGDLARGTAVTLLIRPHQVTVAEGPVMAGRSWRGRVVDHSYTGDVMTYAVDVGGIRLEAASTSDTLQGRSIGSSATVSWTPENALVLPAETNR